MQTAKLTTKGQLVIPKAIRAELHMRTGTSFAVTVENGRVVLEPTTTKTLKLDDWLPALRFHSDISSEQLCAPVDDYINSDMESSDTGVDTDQNAAVPVTNFRSKKKPRR